jgi:hypothetical protein
MGNFPPLNANAMHGPIRLNAPQDEDVEYVRSVRHRRAGRRSAARMWHCFLHRTARNTRLMETGVRLFIPLLR